MNFASSARLLPTSFWLMATWLFGARRRLRTVRLAVLLTGFLRHKGESRDLLMRHLIEPYDAKLFISTWDISNVDRQGNIDRSAVTPTDLKAFYGDCLADVSIRSHELYEQSAPQIVALDRPHDVLIDNPRARAHGTAWMNRLFAQWLIVRDGLRMIRQHEQLTGQTFDTICRTRTDCPLVGDLPGWPDSRVMVSSALPEDLAGKQGLVPDFFFIGPTDEMMKFENMPQAIRTLYDRHYVDTTNAENLLAYFMVQQGIPIAIRDVPLKRFW